VPSTEPGDNRLTSRVPAAHRGNGVQTSLLRIAEGGRVAEHTTMTTRAQRRVEAHNVAAEASHIGSPRRRRANARSELPIAPAEIIPEQPAPARPTLEDVPTRHYLAREHVRRDIGSRIHVLDLAAPGAPASSPPVIQDHDGSAMPYLVLCLTHGAQKYFTAYSSAVRAAKASHHWCEPCKKDLIAFHKLHSRATGRSTHK
jgi:hypothetical protein